MSTVLDALKQIENKAAPKVDGNDECGMMNDECSDSRAKVSSDSSIHHSSFIILHSSIPRFTFPALPESPTAERPTVAWPLCEDTETVRACVETAERIIRQLPVDRPGVLAFTSPGDGGGTTSLLAALAPELARRTTGRILAVDANFRNPDLTARLHFPAGEAAGPSALSFPTSVPRLSFLPAPTSLDGDVRSGNSLHLDDLRKNWSLVLLDAPSLAHPETVPIARRCDGVYLVVRLGHTARLAVEHAARLIRRSGGRLLGCVVVG